MYRNFEPSQLNNSSNTSNMTYLTENDFNIVPPNTLIWEGELPFKEGNTFPTSFIQQRANLYKTNEALYKTQFDGIYSSLFSFNDYMRDAITNYPVLRVLPDLPDFSVCTDTWVDLLGAKPPRINSGDSIKASQVSAIVSASNFATAYQSAVRGSLIIYGNAVFRIDRQEGANAKIVHMPIKNWIPLVNSEDITTIDVNCFFSIFPKGKTHYCEFILYHEDGTVEKITHKYNPLKKVLGAEISREQSVAFDGLGVSPIVVFTGETLGNTVYGEDAYKKWDASISSCIKAYGTILILLERLKEIYRVIPEGASQRDEQTGLTYLQQSGAILYRNLDKNAPDVKLVVPDVPMEEAIKAYKEALTRLSRDTNLSYAIFDSKELGTQMSAKALKTTMYRTELHAKSLTTLITNSTKMLIVKLALACGVEIDLSEFSLLAESGFVQDIETLTEIVQKRNGGAVTLSRSSSISRLDDVSAFEADSYVRELDGLPPETAPETSTTDSGDDSLVSDVNLTHTSTPDTSLTNQAKDGLDYYPLGGANVNG